MSLAPRSLGLCIIFNRPGEVSKDIKIARVTAILLNGFIFPILLSCEASWWRVCYQRGQPHLFFFQSSFLCKLVANFFFFFYV